MPQAVLLGLGAVCGGCAKFPDHGGLADYTRLSFHFTVQGNVNPNYVYVVAIRVLDPAVGTDGRLADPDYGPVPVGTDPHAGETYSGSKNGFVEGLPTQYFRLRPGVPDNWEGFRFLTRQQAPSENDDSPINLAPPGEPLPYVLPDSGLPKVVTSDVDANGHELGFDIDTSYLVRGFTDKNGDPIDPQRITKIQFNILTMNVVARGSNPPAGRVWDALGDQRSFNGQIAYRTVPINTGGTYLNADSSDPEPANDVQGGQDNSVDIVDWSLSVRLGSAPVTNAQ